MSGFKSQMQWEGDSRIRCHECMQVVWWRIDGVRGGAKNRMVSGGSVRWMSKCRCKLGLISHTMHLLFAVH